MLVRIASGEAIVHIADLTDTEAYRSGNRSLVALADKGGARTAVWVALRKEEALLGVLVIYRQEVRAFTEKQIALLQSFAAQAVIAMENARLIAETREALEKQTAMAEILRVISGSPTDVQPTFEAIAASAARICGAATGNVLQFDGSLIHLGAVYGDRPGDLEAVRSVFPIPPSRGSAGARAIQTREIVHIVDPAADPEYAYAALTRFGTLLAVPMLRDGSPLGAIVVTRNRVEPFSGAQIDLLETFADQAVIAIENNRLFNELNERTRDLQESLEYQTATSDVLKVISRSTFDLQPVLDTLVETAARLCNAEMGHLAIREDEVYRYVATHSLSPEWDAIVRDRSLTPGRGTVMGRTALEGRVVHIADLAADTEYTWPEAVAVGKVRTALGVPLLREGDPIGVIVLARQRKEPFTERQIELVRTFADQAVIAIENARLLTELRERTEELARRQAELRASEERYALAMRAVNEAVYEWDVTTGEMYYSPRVHELVGLTEEELQTAADWTDRIHPDDLPGYSEAWAALFKGQTDRFESEYRYRYADGSWHWARQHGIALRNEAGRVYRVVGSTGDITAVKELARELDRARGQLHGAVEALDEGFALFDPEDRLVICNSRYAAFFRDLAGIELQPGMTFESLIRAGLARGMYPHAEDPEAWLAALLARRRHGGTREQYVSTGAWLRVSDYATKDGSIVTVYTDVTDLKRRQQESEEAKEAAELALAQLRAAQQQLVVQQKMAALGQLTAGIAHEIKNPLNFVNNFAGLSNELLAELQEAAAPAIAALDADRRAEIDETMAMLTQNLEKIAEHGRRADGIVRSMLLHSRGGSGDWQPSDLNALIEEALNLAYHGARAQDQSFNITMEREFARDLKPIEVVPQDVTRVFLNLFSNGFYAANKKSRAAHDGFRPVLKVTTRDIGDAVEVRIRDNGTGIPPEHRDKLFQPFFTTKPTGEGTGLGLSISYDIVTQQHGGSIAVESEAGKFTEFAIRLPRKSRQARRAQ
jgi:PAS domain S-box-containing protein